MSEQVGPPVLTRVEGRVGRVTLNRPSALHALTREMCELMTHALLRWLDDAAVEAVILDHAGERGFCAGGDIRMIAESGRSDASEAKAFFHTEYRLNHLLFVYPKPVAAFIDGVVMGGGVGISDPAKYRIATERTTYAMPETGIGLFPDVGGGWFLPRMPGKSGIWLALTGARLKAAECLTLGIATHFVHSSSVEAAKARICESPDLTPSILAELSSDAGPSRVAESLPLIDRLFGGGSVEAIFQALQSDSSEWAAKELATLRAKSPQSLKISFRQLLMGAGLSSFEENMAMEYRLGGRVVRTHDFQEGVRAVIIDKDNAPQWKPAELAHVGDDVVEQFFAHLPAAEEWTPLPEVSGWRRSQ